MNSEILIWILAGVVAVVASNLLSKTYTHISAIAKLCSYLYRNRSSLSKLVSSLEECVSGKNKINQDSVDINRALVDEIVKLRESTTRLYSVVSLDTPVAPIDAVKSRYEDAYSDLIVQGMDPTLAKWAAADHELEQLAGAGIDENIGIGA